LGTVLMRSAGCAINDYADRDFDKHVLRTKERPLTSGKISKKETISIAVGLALVSFLLIQPLNTLTKQLSVFAVMIAGIYPFTKRFFLMPQAVLGVAFSFGIPMAFAAVNCGPLTLQGVWQAVPPVAWGLLAVNLFWVLAYDTEYAMVDRDDDLRIGMKTSAITLGRFDVWAVLLFYAVYLMGSLVLLQSFGLGWPLWFAMEIAAFQALWHFGLIYKREREGCFKAFRMNHWLGATVFAGVAFSLY
jgi:4-hydroxybenzoate polyprenyltransferase